MNETMDEWIDFIRGGQMIAAIKSYRQSHNVGLAEAQGYRTMNS